MRKRIRVLLADDHKIVLDGLRSLLEPEFDLVGTVEDGRALVSAVETVAPRRDCGGYFDALTQWH